MKLNNIFEDAISNYYNLQEGEHHCKVNFVVNYNIDHKKIIEFYVTYKEGNYYKNVSVKYTFTDKNKNITMREILELLVAYNPKLNSDKLFLRSLYNDEDLLFDACQELEGKSCILTVNYNKKADGTNYKYLKLIPFAEN